MERLLYFLELREEEDRKHREEDIYEEPPADSPANSLASGSIYIVKEGGKEGKHREMRRMTRQQQREADREKDLRTGERRRGRSHQEPRRRWSREYHRPESYHAYDDYDPRVEALRPGWKQFYLDGAIRPPLPEAPPRRRPRGMGPYPGVLPPDIPDMGPGRMRGSFPASHSFRHRAEHIPGPPPPYRARPLW